MTILVTGCAGFIGSHLTEKLLNEGHRVLGIDNFQTGAMKNMLSFIDNENFVFVKQDIEEPIKVGDALDQIYHLACPAAPVHYQKNPIKTLSTAFIGTKNLLDLAMRKNATILYTSTSEIYGDPLEHPQNEKYWGNVNPIGERSCYDEGKRAAEALSFAYHRQENVAIRVVRIFNTYGPRMAKNDGRVVPNFVLQSLANEPITIYGTGDQTRSFCYVDDMVSGLITMINNDAKFTGPVNLGNPAEITMRSLAETIIRLTNSKSELTCKPLPSDDPHRRKPDISLAQEKLTWQPSIDLEAGLQKTIEYFKSK
ncbi:NAD-dependent dehydratase [bacterium CG10_46_32]|nr:MAG: NAD-dependent dehydratase [bacterium CG10_46_32]PIR56372.1 MAG: NAD-dependent dehydratase [Parcubacteria group bacterium CG10_big_fil_rev_8_21_14_0_10_46_32]